METYTIITTDANAALAPIRDRMPVIVPADRYAMWLDVNEDPRAPLAPFYPEPIRIERA